MPDYSNAKIYHIIAPDGSKYIGSTTQEIYKRFTTHKSNYRSWKKGQHHFVTCYELFENDNIDNCVVELIENYPCNSKKELEKREGQLIQETICVNKVIAGREDTVWRAENREKLLDYWSSYYKENITTYQLRNKTYYKNNKDSEKERHKKYYEANKDKINEKRRLERHERKTQIEFPTQNK